MNRIELLQTTANTLISSAKTQEEKDFYTQMYNYLLGKKQQEVIAHEKY